MNQAFINANISSSHDFETILKKVFLFKLPRRTSMPDYYHHHKTLNHIQILKYVWHGTIL